LTGLYLVLYFGAMDMAAMQNFRRNLATALEARELTKVSVAAAAEMSRMHLDSVLKGTTEPGIGTCERLAIAVGFPLVALLEQPDVFSEAVLTGVK
jgi:DNA-binding phage protein